MTREFWNFGACSIATETVHVTYKRRRVTSLSCEIRTTDGGRHRLVLDSPTLNLAANLEQHDPASQEFVDYVVGKWANCCIREETNQNTPELATYGVDLWRDVPNKYRSLRASNCRIEPII
jgi:hypothetical protein